MKRRAVLLGLLLVLAACGGSSPPSPSANLNLAGTWTGSWQFVTSGATITDAVTATLSQNGATVTGTWSGESGASGQFTSLTPQASTTGSLTIAQPTLTGAVCTATTAVSGTASASSLELAVPQIAPSGICQWASGMQFSLRKQ
jgi:hypothetical protein